jgi:excisionase family DNA binding protein
MAARSLTRDDVLTMREVADLLRLPLSTVGEFARRGTLPARKLGRRWIFLRDELEDALRAAPTSLARSHEA